MEIEVEEAGLNCSSAGDQDIDTVDGSAGELAGGLVEELAGEPVVEPGNGLEHESVNRLANGVDIALEDVTEADPEHSLEEEPEEEEAEDCGSICAAWKVLGAFVER